jgi:TolB protein
MTDPRRASVKFLALLTLGCLAAALPLKHAAQSVPSKQPSPNGKIVYQSDQAGDPGVNDIYTMDADGKHETRLTNNTTDDAAPVWSPQGNNIAFISDRRGNGYEVYLMNADGSNQRPLRADSPVYAIAAAWSPDGTRLSYESDNNVYIIEATAPGGGDSTAAPVNVSADKAVGSKDSEASWSPGGKLVLRNSLDCGGCSDLYTVNADGSGRAQLTSGPGFDATPRWSPSGDFVAYEADRGDGRALYVIDAQGIGPEVKLSGVVGSLGAPTWCPDGSRLAFTSSAGPVYAVNTDGSGLMMLSDMPGISSGSFWSPDGRKVAFQNGGDVHVVSADGTSRRPANYTKTKRADEFASSWQCLPMP